MARRGESVVELRGLSTEQILALADERNHRWLRKAIAEIVTGADAELLRRHVTVEKPFAADVALAGLERLAPEGFAGWLGAFWPAHPEMRGWLRSRFAHALLSLPPAETMPMARARLFHANGHERDLAEWLFGAHAALEDMPVLREALRQGMEDDEGNCYRLCSLVDAFSHFPGAGRVAELEEVFVQFRYSHGRIRAANAIHVTDPAGFRERFAGECLWDCVEETRLLGAKAGGYGGSAAWGGSF